MLGAYWGANKEMMKWLRNAAPISSHLGKAHSVQFLKWLRNDRDLLEKWSRNDWEMIEKWLRNDWEMIEKCWEMIEKWLRNDWEMIEKWSRNAAQHFHMYTFQNSQYMY
jgi:hypothetical protein